MKIERAEFCHTVCCDENSALKAWDMLFLTEKEHVKGLLFYESQVDFPTVVRPDEIDAGL